MKRIFQKMKLFHKTFLMMLAAFSVVIIISDAVIVLFLPKLYLNRLQSDLHAHMERLTPLIEATDWQHCDELLESFAFRNNINIYAKHGEEEKTFRVTAFYVFTDIYEDMQVTMKDVENVESIVIESQNLTFQDNSSVFLQMMVSAQPGRKAVWLTFLLFPLSTGIAILLSIPFSYLYSKRLIRPIRNMLTVTSGMKNLKEDAYFTVEGGDELATMADQINQVYAHLWQTIRSLEREKKNMSEMEGLRINFFRSASHALKTPLTGLRTLLENMFFDAGAHSDSADSLNTGIQAVDKLTSMVNEILAASQIQGAAGQAERTLLLVQEEIGQLLADYEVLAKIRNLSISFEVEKELQLNMNPRYFRQVWSNLIDNAIRYTPTGGRIRITGNSNVLAIWNSCKPLSGVQLQKIFDPFYRGEDAKSAYSAGTGLGLYLVKEILNANQLPFSFVPYDGGMRFQIRLPRA